MRIDQGRVGEMTLMYANRLVCETTDMHIAVSRNALLHKQKSCLDFFGNLFHIYLNYFNFNFLFFTLF